MTAKMHVLSTEMSHLRQTSGNREKMKCYSFKSFRITAELVWSIAKGKVDRKMYK